MTPWRVSLGFVLALFAAACAAPAAMRQLERFVPAAGVEGRLAPPITASVRARDDGVAVVALTVVWPPRDRQVASIPPSAERVKFELGGADRPDLDIPVVERRESGSKNAYFANVDFEIPWKRDADVQVRATASSSTEVVAQSRWTKLPLRRNTVVTVGIELFRAAQRDGRIEFLVPVITGVEPDRGYPGITSVKLSGLNFGYSKGPDSAVLFGGEEALEASKWEDAPQGATIELTLPQNARTGPVAVRLGKVEDNLSATWAPSPVPQDPWSGRFSVLGPEGDEVRFDSGPVADYRIAYDRKSQQFWVAWCRSALVGTNPGHEILVSPVGTADLRPVAGGPFPRKVAFAEDIRVPDGKGGWVTRLPGVQLGGVVGDPEGGAWLDWEEVVSGSELRIRLARVARITGTITFVQNPASTTPADTAFPTLAMNADRTLLVAWVDTMDTGDSTLVHPRIYSRLATPSSQPFFLNSKPLPVQQSNTNIKGDQDTLAAVGPPSVASDGKDFLVAWHEQGASPRSLELKFQRMVSIDAQSAPANVSRTMTGASLEEPQLVWSDRDTGYMVAYVKRPGDMYATGSSDVFIQGRDTLGMERNEGGLSCPGSPCGGGNRTQPQIVWNGRDYVIAWQYQRDGIGEVDIQGARRQRDTGGKLTWATEEAGPNAEILFSVKDGVSRAGIQSAPRLAWGKDYMLAGWLEDGALYLRAWR